MVFLLNLESFFFDVIKVISTTKKKETYQAAITAGSAQGCQKSYRRAVTRPHDPHEDQPQTGHRRYSDDKLESHRRGKDTL